MLVDSGAELNDCSGCGDLPLIEAMYTGQIKVIRILLAKGAMIDGVSGLIETPVLHAGVMAGDTEILELLSTACDLSPAVDRVVPWDDAPSVWPTMTGKTIYTRI